MKGLHARIALLVALSVMVTGCGDIDLDASPEKRADNATEAFHILEKEGVLPKLDRSDSLVGIDADDDGIRDDIETFIEQKSVPEPQKEGLRTFARGMQDIQAADQITPEIAGSITDTYSAEYFCLTAFSDNMDEMLRIFSEVEAFTANTPKRAERYLEYTEAMDGRNMSLPSSSRCSEVGQ
ncbi:hypothetical protein [Marinobacter salicampi]|uniref:hypothetical protein n=1 Tax=Marinobacter salicampi TaxID=435907 RepID=UPI00140D83B2|nr:hypothetical protein [Marinobacter salicampi]